MQAVMTILFALSYWGFANLAEIAGFPRQLKWLVASAGLINLLYLFAMLDQLEMGYWILLMGGIICQLIRWGLVFSKKWQPIFADERVHLYDFWMLLVGILFAIQLLKSPLIHYDNYSHWAVMVKYLHFTGHLPDATQKLITFTSYLPGSSLFIAYVIRFLGYSSRTMLLGQFFLIWSAIGSLFAVLPDQRRRLNQLAICIAIGLSMMANISIRTNNLLVDYLLAVFTAGGLAGIWALRQKPSLQLIFFFFIASSLLLIKNSGSFFVLLLMVYLLALKKKWTWRLADLAGAGLAFLPFWTWQQHVKAVFPHAGNHAINTQHYENALAGQSQGDLIALGKRILHHLLSWNTLSTREWVLINIYGLLLFAAVNLILKKKQPILRTVFALDFMIGLFYLSLYATYAMTMTKKEAMSLNGFERYMSTVIIIAILAMGALTSVVIDRCYVEQNIEKRNIKSYQSIFSKNLYQMATMILLVFSVIFMLSETNGLAYNTQIAQKELPVKLANTAKEETQLNHKKILLVDAEPVNVDDDYDYYLGRYWFFSDQVTAREAFDMSADTFKNYIYRYDYVVLPVKHQTFSSLTKQAFQEKVSTGLYQVTAGGLEKVKNGRINLESR
jgi:hypothetical protein